MVSEVLDPTGPDGLWSNSWTDWLKERRFDDANTLVLPWEWRPQSTKTYWEGRVQLNSLLRNSFEAFLTLSISCRISFLRMFLWQFLGVLLSQFLMSVSSCYFAFSCQYWCNRLASKTCLLNYLLCAKWDVKLHFTHTHYSFDDTLLIWNAFETAWVAYCAMSDVAGWHPVVL